MDTTALTNEIRDRLMEDLELVIRDAEDLLRNAGSQAGESYQIARARLESTLSTARENLATLEQGAREAFDTADRYVQANPWQAVGIGAAAGVLVGMLVGRIR